MYGLNRQGNADRSEHRKTQPEEQPIRSPRRCISYDHVIMQYNDGQRFSYLTCLFLTVFLSTQIFNEDSDRKGGSKGDASLVHVPEGRSLNSSHNNIIPTIAYIKEQYPGKQLKLLPRVEMRSHFQGR